MGRRRLETAREVLSDVPNGHRLSDCLQTSCLIQREREGDHLPEISPRRFGSLAVLVHLPWKLHLPHCYGRGRRERLFIFFFKRKKKEMKEEGVCKRRGGNAMRSDHVHAVSSQCGFRRKGGGLCCAYAKHICLAKKKRKKGWDVK